MTSPILMILGMGGIRACGTTARTGSKMAARGEFIKTAVDVATLPMSMESDVQPNNNPYGAPSPDYAADFLTTNGKDPMKAPTIWKKMELEIDIELKSKYSIKTKKVFTDTSQFVTINAESQGRKVLISLFELPAIRETYSVVFDNVFQAISKQKIRKEVEIDKLIQKQAKIREITLEKELGFKIEKDSISKFNFKEYNTITGLVIRQSDDENGKWICQFNLKNAIKSFIKKEKGYYKLKFQE